MDSSRYFTWYSTTVYPTRGSVPRFGITTRDQARCIKLATFWGFHSHGGIPKFVVYNGKSWKNIWKLGFISWNILLIWRFISWKKTIYNTHDGSMVLLYMVTWIPSRYPSHVSIYHIYHTWILFTTYIIYTIYTIYHIYQRHGSVMGYFYGSWGGLETAPSEMHNFFWGIRSQKGWRIWNGKA